MKEIKQMLKLRNDKIAEMKEVAEVYYGGIDRAILGHQNALKDARKRQDNKKVKLFLASLRIFYHIKKQGDQE